MKVEGAWPALVSRELFDDARQAMSERPPKVQRPGRVGSKFLLSGLLKCGVCGRPYSTQGAKSGQFAYYVCGTLFRSGDIQRPITERPEAGDVRSGEDQGADSQRGDHRGAGDARGGGDDAMAGELSGRLEVVEAKLGDVRKRLEKLHKAIETSELAPPLEMSPPHRVSEAP